MKTLGVLFLSGCRWLSAFGIILTLLTCAEAGQVDVVPPKPVYPHHGLTQPDLLSGGDTLAWSSVLHYRCSKDKDGTTITLTPIEGGLKIINLSCLNCECTGEK